VSSFDAPAVDEYPVDEFTDLELAEHDEFGPVALSEPDVSAAAEAMSTSMDDGAADGADPSVQDAHMIAARLGEHVADLDSLADADLSDHIGYYQRVHADLQRALGDIDDAP
jgi:hypothetical protein